MSQHLSVNIFRYLFINIFQIVATILGPTFLYQHFGDLFSGVGASHGGRASSRTWGRDG
jgi:hypothetical protein